MSKLNELLAIIDSAERQAALVRYARQLGVDPQEAKDSRGSMVEEKLVILIFDGETRRKRNWVYDARFLTGGLAVTIFMFAFITFLPKIYFSISGRQKQEETSRGKVLRAYDVSGKPVMHEGQPATFEVMNGVYRDYGADKKLQYEYFYKDGQLVRKKQYNTKGKVIADQKFP